MSKVTCRTIEYAARMANNAVLRDYPFGLKVEPKGDQYRLFLMWRDSVSKERTLIIGSTREVAAAIESIHIFAAAAVGAKS